MSESQPANNRRIDRRALLLGAVFLAGGAAALTHFTRGQRPRRVAAQAFSAEQFTLLEQVSEVIIPATDTPGAIGAGVPVFLRSLLASWGTDETRLQVLAVLEAIDRQSWSKFGAAFVELPGEQRFELMRLYDETAIAMRDVAYGKFKHLVLLSYYQSEVGATQELRYELVPGAWRSCLPLTEVGRASAV